MIIVDDGSPDKTSEVRFFVLLINDYLFCFKLALKFSAQYGVDIVRVLTLDANRGKGGAVRMVKRSL